MYEKWNKTGVFLGLALVAAWCAMPTAHAETIKSNNYKFDESSLGTSGTLNSGSANYGARETTGDIGVGNSASGNYQINAGSNTTHAPTLAFSVNSSGANLGKFSASTPATATATFSVLNYTSYGYVVQISGPPPSNAGHTIKPMDIIGPSQTGVEQFGMNLVANTNPTSVGANPDNGQFGFGSVAANYNTPNNYYYSDSDIIARASKDSGVTNYTITYLVNVAGLTPGGVYTTNQTLIVTGTY